MRYSEIKEATKPVISIVKTLLTEITDAAYNGLKAAFAARARDMLDAYLTEQKVKRAEGKVLPLAIFYPYAMPMLGQRQPYPQNPEAYHVVDQLTHTDTDYDGRGKEVTVLPDAEKIIARLSAKEADKIRDMFINKNLVKIDGIVTAKGNFTEAKVIGSEIELGALRGSLRFNFADGSAFTVQNSVVWSHSIHNTQFVRYPLTFHDVVLAGGVKMPRPSEARMKSVFLGG